MPRSITGVLLLDKPLGITSNTALQRVKRIYQARKAGHTGTLDPLATGLLPICLGEATKFSGFMLDASKTYEALLRLGETTTTHDLEGDVLERRPVNVSQNDLVATLERFTGHISQTPPLYSALKHRGRPLYHYARAGTDVPREQRSVYVHELELLSFCGDQFTIRVTCSKGTYVRTLAADIGEALGCGAHLGALRRLSCASLSLEHAVTMDALEHLAEQERDTIVLPPDVLVASLWKLVVGPEDAANLQNGLVVSAPDNSMPGLARVYDENEMYLGVAECTAEGKLRARRLMARNPSSGDVIAS